ncbi:hypothetical protein PUATCC27989T_01067 [Phytobacter ursingii]|nr:hypothetical protein PUATCC27989T_01067 [Phytobacter ursingii]
MLVSGTDILETARHCLAQGNESGYRSAISRAYYSMLHEAMSSLEHLPHFTHEHHKNTVGYMTNSAECRNEPFPVNQLKSLGFILRSQRDARNEADYDLVNVSLDDNNAAVAIEIAESFFERWAAMKAPKAS